jgi:hypothetical protein
VNGTGRTAVCASKVTRRLTRVRSLLADCIFPQQNISTRLPRAWNIWAPAAYREAHRGHMKIPMLREIFRSRITNVAVRVRKTSLEGDVRLTLQTPGHLARNMNSVIAVFADLNWSIVEDLNVAVEEREAFSSRRVLTTADALRGGDDSSGAPHDEFDVDSTSTATTARAVRAEDREARALDALRAERAAKEAAEAAKEAAEAAKEAAEAAKEAAEANVARLMALLAAAKLEV